MVAPIDATASFEADGETVTLALNYRTIALAEQLQRGAVTDFGAGQPSISSLTALLWGLAQPAHPGITPNHALALAIGHGEAAGVALGELFAKATPTAKPGDKARPRRAGTDA